MIRQMVGGAFVARIAAFVWISMIFGLTGPAAQAADVFSVTGVSIDATADDATAARDAAVRSGQKRALEVLWWRHRALAACREPRGLLRGA